jgi:hypothetical protein
MVKMETTAEHGPGTNTGEKAMAKHDDHNVTINKTRGGKFQHHLIVANITITLTNAPIKNKQNTMFLAVI